MVDQYEGNADPDLAAYRRAGHLRYMHKATEGRYHIDAKHAERVRAAHAVGLFVTHYHFCRPDQGPAAREEMRLFWAVCHSLFLPGDRLCLDCEPGGTGRWDAPLEYVPDAWGCLYDLSGVRATIYGDTSFLASRVPVAWLRAHDRHEAAYGPAPDNLPWRRHWWAWQYTDGSVGRWRRPVAGVGLGDQSMLSMPAALADKGRWRRRRQLVKHEAGK
jgi:GH25 family lysozyme M1 (1,4-beta-N-acetylmuramidase)